MRWNINENLGVLLMKSTITVVSLRVYLHFRYLTVNQVTYDWILSWPCKQNHSIIMKPFCWNICTFLIIYLYKPHNIRRPKSTMESFLRSLDWLLFGSSGSSSNHLLKPSGHCFMSSCCPPLYFLIPDMLTKPFISLIFGSLCSRKTPTPSLFLSQFAHSILIAWYISDKNRGFLGSGRNQYTKMAHAQYISSIIMAWSMFCCGHWGKISCLQFPNSDI